MALGDITVDEFVGLKIRSRRREVGMSQQRLGHAVGVSFQQIQKYERGKNTVSASTLMLIAARLEVSVGHFFDDIQSGGFEPPAADAHGPQASGSELLHHLGDRDVVNLLESFCRLSSDRMRQRVLTLVKSIADDF